MKRVAIVGSSGVGKTWLATRIAGLLEIPHVELDALHHGPGWTVISAGDMRHQIDLLCPADGDWIADGNYETKGGKLIRERADTVVWLDFPRRTVMRQLVIRTVRRVLLREPLWNDNRESLRDVLSRDPERSVLVWSWTHHHPQRDRYAAQADKRWVRLAARREVRRFLNELQASNPMKPPPKSAGRESRAERCPPSLSRPGGQKHHDRLGDDS